MIDSYECFMDDSRVKVCTSIPNPFTSSCGFQCVNVQRLHPNLDLTTEDSAVDLELDRWRKLKRLKEENRGSLDKTSGLLLLMYFTVSPTDRLSSPIYLQVREQTVVRWFSVVTLLPWRDKVVVYRFHRTRNGSSTLRTSELRGMCFPFILRQNVPVELLQMFPGSV